MQARRHLLDEVFRERGRVDHGAAQQSGGVDAAKHILVAVAALLQFVQPPGQPTERPAVDDRLGQRRQPRAGPDLAHRGDGSGVPDVVGFGEVVGGGGGVLRGQGGEGVQPIDLVRAAGEQLVGQAERSVVAGAADRRRHRGWAASVGAAGGEQPHPIVGDRPNPDRHPAMAVHDRPPAALALCLVLRRRGPLRA